MTFIEVLAARAREQGRDRAYTFIGGTGEDVHVTYSELDGTARAIGALLQGYGLHGKAVMLLLPPGLDYVRALAGCLYAGSIAVPGYPPREGEKSGLIHSMSTDCGATAVLTNRRLQPRFAGDPWPEAIAIEDARPELATGWADPSVETQTIALLQYTSGSTRVPRGVMIDHENLVRNCEMIREASGSSERTRSVMWLPPYHDMGLVGGIMHPLFTGFPSVLMSPFAFLQQPSRWLEAVSDYGATLSGGPNFAFRLCAERIGEDERDSLDLSSWEVAFCGAEPIHHATLERFADEFRSCGFRRESFFPCYGMAEATLIISGRRGGPVCHEVSAADLEQGRVRDAVDSVGRTLVGCGGPIGGEEILIVNAETLRESGTAEIGEIWVAGPGVARGYWNRPKETAETFGAWTSDTRRGPFLRTGDLGYIHGGEVYVTGRLKDLIVIHGRNLYPQDIELTVAESHAALRGHYGAAFSVEDSGDGGEQLVVVHEADRHLDPGTVDEVLSAVRREIAGQHDVSAHAIVLVRKNSLPKTSSGKIRRRMCRTRFLDRQLSVIVEWREPDVLELLVSELSKRLGTGAGELDVRLPFAHWGLDSLKAVELAAELETLLGRPLPATLAYDYPTLESMAAYLSGAPPRPHRVESEPPRSHHRSNEPVAIVGIGCRFPGAHGPDAYAALLGQGRDAISEVPSDRWQAAAYFDADPDTPGKVSTRWGGFLKDIDRFDPDFFGISRREAARMDPQQRILLETAWEAFEDAGLRRDQIVGSSTGVWVGISSSDYARSMLADPEGIDAYTGTGNAFSIAANRLSYAFDLHGPSIAIDTACSSSLVAVHLACTSLRSGECTLALAGGVNLILSPDITMNFSRAHAMASDGRCKAFDARADGYVRSEGAGLVVLKPLARAVADRDPIYAVIRGTAVNQDGRTNGIMAPSRGAQEDVLRAACRDAGVTPAELEYIETHGTGTLLGDSIEAAALGGVLGSGRDGRRKCVIGSAKTNIGHLEAAAGVAGLIKTALMFDRREIPPNLHYETPNPHIDFEDLPLTVPRELQRWTSAESAVAGVSSFGFGGTNAHVVVSSAPAPPVPEDADDPVSSTLPCVLPLSAHTERALEMRATRLSRWLREIGHEDDEPWLVDLCYTASVRRTHLKHRAAFVFRTPQELKDLLARFIDGQEPPSGEAGGAGESETHSLVSEYLKGGDVPWERLYPGGRRCLRLPEYPWQGERCWFESAVPRDVTAKASHPLLGRRLGPESPAAVRIWESRIGASSPAFLWDHRVQGAPVFPAAAYLEMAFAAAREEFGEERCSVRDIAFEAPLVVPREGQRSVQFVLSLGVPDLGRFRVLSSEGSQEWTLHASGILGPAPPEGQKVDTRELRGRCGRETSAEVLYSTLADRGLDYGPSFRLIRRLWTNPVEALCRIEVPPDEDEQRTPYVFHPAVLDCCAQMLAGMDRFGVSSSLPKALRELRLYGRPGARLWSHATSRSEGSGDVRVFDDSGRLLAEASGLRFHRSPVMDCQYEVRWRPRTGGTSEKAPDAWLIVPGLDGIGEELADQLRQGGSRWVLVSNLDPQRPENALDEVNALPEVPTIGVVYLRALASSRGPAEDCGVIVRLVRKMARSRQRQSFRLWLMTSGAWSVAGEPLEGAFQAPLWGLGRTIACEHPEVWGGLVDLDPNDDPGHARTLAKELLAPAGEDQIAFRDSNIYVPRLVRWKVTPGPGALELRRDSTYLITGGLGGLGLRLAQWMVEHGARRLVLLGRSPLPPRSTWGEVDNGSRVGRQIAGVRGIERMGASVHLAFVDVADEGQLAGFLESFRRESWPPIRGVIHAAGVLDDQLLLNMTDKALEDVFRAKVDGAVMLDSLLREEPLDFFVMFSSAASLLGSEGQAGYAAANAYLDALSFQRRDQGLPALTINWGPWDEVGMAAESPALARFSRHGIDALRSEDALAIFERLLADAPAQVCVLRTNWPELFRRKSILRNWPFLRELEDGATPTATGGPLARILEAPPEERLGVLQAFLMDEVARTVATLPESLDVDHRLSDLGIDSLMSVELKTSLEEQLRIEIPAVTFLEDPTIAGFANLVAERLAPARAVGVTSPSAIALRVGGGGQASPVFLIHPGGVDVQLYAPLAEYLPDRPLDALVPVSESPTVREVARRCAEEICRLQPRGAVAIGGWSLGGVVAFEVARQMSGLDREVEVLCLLDSPTPSATERLAIENEGLRRAFGSYLGARNGVLFQSEQGADFSTLYEEAKRAGIIGREQRYTDFVSMFETYRRGLESALAQFQDYEPGIFHGRTVLFRAAGEVGSRALFPTDAFLWRELVDRDPETHVVPGDHYTMFLQPHVDTLGPLLNRCVDGSRRTSQTVA